jgi:hypothetical protein
MSIIAVPCTLDAYTDTLNTEQIYSSIKTWQLQDLVKQLVSVVTITKSAESKDGYRSPLYAGCLRFLLYSN